MNNKYVRSLTSLCGVNVSVDVYRVLDAFKVTNPQLQHLAKKALCVGVRGHKDERQDLVDILNSAQSALDMYDHKNLKGDK
tara:strand:+ start:309 stop:551 length:243 start_codon:yes stop_codon:yes gene_type:complete